MSYPYVDTDTNLVDVRVRKCRLFLCINKRFLFFSKFCDVCYNKNLGIEKKKWSWSGKGGFLSCLFSCQTEEKIQFKNLQGGWQVSSHLLHGKTSILVFLIYGWFFSAFFLDLLPQYLMACMLWIGCPGLDFGRGCAHGVMPCMKWLPI